MILAVAALTIPTLSIPALGKDKKDKSTEVIKENQKAVLEVNLKDKTVTIDFNSTQAITTYAIDDFTVVEVNGQPAKLEDVKKGMIVTDLMERDAHTLDRFAVKTYIKEVKGKN